MGITRREFIGSALAGAGAIAIGGRAEAVSTSVNLALPQHSVIGTPPKYPNIQHVVVVMMENRSTDHYLGWWGDRPDVRFDASRTHPTLTTADFGGSGAGNFTGHGYGDPSHSHGNGRRQLWDHDGDGVPDGWRVGGNPAAGTDDFALSHYGEADLPVIAQIVRDFTAFDRYHCSWMGSTYPNRYYMHSGQAGGRTNNTFPQQVAFEEQEPELVLGWRWPTLWDQLDRAGVTWKYYYSNLPVIGLFGPEYLHNSRPITEYYADCAAGLLPQVSFVDPFFVAPEGLANDDHPHADNRLGQEFYSDVVTAFLGSPNWFKGAMWINYDEWGGFWDHVVPPVVDQAADPGAVTAAGGTAPDYTSPGLATSPVDFGLFGFRTPAFLISPYARNLGSSPPGWSRGRGHDEADGKGHRNHDESLWIDRTVSSVQDHTTILAFIADNWGLAPVGDWHADARRPVGTMLDAFDLARISDPADPGDPDVDVASYDYTAPPEAREALTDPERVANQLWSVADRLEGLGFPINTSFAAALPETR